MQAKPFQDSFLSAIKRVSKTRHSTLIPLCKQPTPQHYHANCGRVNQRFKVTIVQGSMGIILKSHD